MKFLSKDYGRGLHYSSYPEYRVLALMKTRCNYKNAKDYHRYGGRGIIVCKRWQTFENFIADMGIRPSPRHQIDRIDNDGNYEPGNCRWVTHAENNSNRSSNHKVIINGVSKTLAQLARETGLSKPAIRWRVINWKAENWLKPMDNLQKRIQKSRRQNSSRKNIPRP